jgi:hypothetical protein
MENSIATLIAIDKKARETAEAAARRADEILEAARAEHESLVRENDEKLNAQTKARLDELKASSDREIAEADRAADEKCRSLDEKMAANRDSFKREIVGRILTTG